MAEAVQILHKTIQNWPREKTQGLAGTATLIGLNILQMVYVRNWADLTTY